MIFRFFCITLLSFFFFSGCSSKQLVGPTLPVVPTSSLDQDFSFLKDCSQIRAVTPMLWLLTCQKPPHADRTEIYEWSVDQQKLRRLTFQDGQIWDIAPIDSQKFYYSSSYDEFKEQFASIVNGAKVGSDIYLKHRADTDFQRITSQKGLEISFFWYAPKDLLYFVHENDSASQIMTLGSSKQLQEIYSAPKKTLRNPVYMQNSRNLYWIEYDPGEKGAVIKSLNRYKKVSDVYKSDSKIFQLGAFSRPEQLLVGFVAGVGVEIWNLNLIDGCWRMAYRTAEPVSEFYVMNDKTLFLTIKNSLKRDTFLDYSEVCYPSPPGLGVTAL